MFHGVAQYKPKRSNPNESTAKNELNREFRQEKELSVIVSDLTYVRVQNKWSYVCIFVDLFNREIIGYNVGEHKDASLVARAIATIPSDLRRVGMFHTDRGSEFNNRLVSDTLRSFGIRRSLSDKGCPYDNAVSEAMYKVIKTEFVRKRNFPNLTALDRELRDYIHWFNNIRVHGTLGYLTPREYKQRHLFEIV